VEFCGEDSLYLRVVQPADAARIKRWKEDPLLRRMALGRAHETSDAKEREEIERALGSDRELYLVVVLREGDHPIGYIRINWIDGDASLAWLRFALGERRGEGHAKRALRCLIAHLFTRGLHRVDAEVYQFNETSLALLERLGFRREGVKRRACRDGEAWRDVVVLGLLRDDFR
jgi:RimJ/RimL family protein N-acetyltransferase